MSVVLVGASGKLGGIIAAALAQSGKTVRCVSQSRPSKELTNIVGIELVQVSNYETADWSTILKDAKQLIWVTGTASSHLVTKDIFDLEIRNAKAVTNVAFATKPLHTIFISSILAATTQTHSYEFTYSNLKLELEKVWQDQCGKANSSLIIFRAGSVYGRDIKGRLFGIPAQFRKIARLPILFPIPRGETRKQLLYTGNLVSALLYVVENNAHATGQFNLVDKQPITTKHLLKTIISKLNGNIVLVSIPDSLYRLTGKFLSRVLPGSLVARLAEWLYRDDPIVENDFSKTGNWKQPFDLDTALECMFEET